MNFREIHSRLPPGSRILRTNSIGGHIWRFILAIPLERLAGISTPNELEVTVTHWFHDIGHIHRIEHVHEWNMGRVSLDIQVILNEDIVVFQDPEGYQFGRRQAVERIGGWLNDVEIDIQAIRDMTRPAQISWFEGMDRWIMGIDRAAPDITEEANQKARQLLFEELNKKQRICFQKNEYFEMKTKNGHFKIHRAPNYGIRWRRNDEIEHECCLTTTESIPLDEQLLIQKIMIENDFDTFLRTANMRIRRYLF